MTDDQTQATTQNQTTEAPVEDTPIMDGTNEAPTEDVASEEQVVEKTPADDSVIASETKQPSEDQLTSDEPAEKPAEEVTSNSNIPADAKWYIVHTYSGHENKVSHGIKQRSETMGFTDKIFDIIVPTREVTKVAQGKKSQVQEKIFPGYVLVRMVLTDESWLLVRTTQGVTAFIGAGNKPTPISEKEVEAIQKFMKLEEPLYKTGFSVNEAVKIVDGPFADFLGTIESIDEAKGKLRVLVSIFGRETPVELDFLQVAKI